MYDSPLRLGILMPRPGDPLEGLPAGLELRHNPEFPQDRGIVAFHQMSAGLIPLRSGIRQSHLGPGAEGHRFLLAVVAVIPPPQLSPARRHEQEQAIGVGQFVGFGAGLGRPDFGVTEHRSSSPKSTTFFDRRDHESVPQSPQNACGGLWTTAAELVSQASVIREKKSRSVDFWRPLRRVKWRRGRDSNPRYPHGHAAFRVRCIRPLCHLSAEDRKH